MQGVSPKDLVAQLVNLTSSGPSHALPILLHFAHGCMPRSVLRLGRHQPPRAAMVRILTMQLLADGTYWGASCGQSSPATPLFRVARHAASLPEGRNSQSCTPRAGRGRKPDSRRAARISYRPHPSRPPHRYWIPGTVAGLHRGNRAIWRRGSRGATIRVRPLPLGPFAIVSRSFARETWHVRLHRETAKHLPCVEYPVSGKKVRLEPFPSFRVAARSFHCEKPCAPTGSLAPKRRGLRL